MHLTPDIDAFIESHLHADISQIALTYDKQAPYSIDFVIQQIKGRRKVKTKIPSWNNHRLIYPKVVSMEQSSSEWTARYKAGFMSGHRLLDLTGGLGVDTYFLSNHFERVDYVEQDKSLSEIFAYNIEQLQAKNIHIHQGDGMAFLLRQHGQVDWIYLDPGRRDLSNRKMVQIADYSPNILAHQQELLKKGANILVKMSPLLDLELIKRQMGHLVNIHVVAVKNECKEILVHQSRSVLEDHDPSIITVDLSTSIPMSSMYFAGRRSRRPIQIDDPKKYIYEPNRAILKAGLQDQLAVEMDIAKIAPLSNFFTSDELRPDFPGRKFELKEVIKLRAKYIKPHLDGGKANVIARNFPMKASEIYDKFGIIPGGDIYLLATSLANTKKAVMVCQRR